MGKKLNSLEDLGGFVFSTNEDFQPHEEETTSLEPSEQNLEAHIEKKGRNGKPVAIIKGFYGSDEQLKDLAKQLKSYCGVGGTVKNGEIIMQGNVRDKIMDLLKREGYNVKRVGG